MLATIGAGGGVRAGGGGGVGVGGVAPFWRFGALGERAVVIGERTTAGFGWGATVLGRRLSRNFASMASVTHLFSRTCSNSLAGKNWASRSRSAPSRPAEARDRKTDFLRSVTAFVVGGGGVGEEKEVVEDELRCAPGGGGGVGRLVAGKRKRGGKKKGTGGGTERLVRSDPARGQLRAQLVARLFKMGGRNSNREKTDTKAVTKRVVCEYAQKKSIKRKIRCQRYSRCASTEDRSTLWVA